MSSVSVYRTTFHIENTAGKVVAGPYTANIGVSGGTRGDIHSPSVTTSLTTAIQNNLLSILQQVGFGGSAGPSGVVALETYSHAGAPDVWI